MKKTAFLWAMLLLLPLFGCAALPAPREAEDMRPVQVLGVDADGAGVRVTAISATRAQVQTYSATAESLAAACAAIEQQASATLFYGHVEQLLLGEALAARGLEEVLTYVAQSRELRPDMELFLVRGEAQQLLTGGASPAAERLAALSRREETVTVRQTLVALTRGGSAKLPALTLYKEGDFMPAGWGRLRGDVLTGWEGE